MIDLVSGEETNTFVERVLPLEAFLDFFYSIPVAERLWLKGRDGRCKLVDWHTETLVGFDPE